MDTDSLYLALSEKELYDCFGKESKVEWELMRTEYCKDDFTANATTNFFPRTCCTKHMKHDKREPGLFNFQRGVSLYGNVVFVQQNLLLL